MKDMPLTVRRSIELLGLVLIGYIMVIGNSIIMPVIMAFFISILLLPVFRFFIRIKFPEVAAIIIPILLLAIFIGLIVWFFSAQIGLLVDDFPQIKRNVGIHIKSLQDWIGRISKFSTNEQAKFISDKSNDLLGMAGKAASGAAVTLSSVFVFVGLLPIYIYLMLFYKDILLRFIFMWFKQDHHPKVKEAIYETEAIIKNYLIGLLIQVTYMTILLGGILFFIGIKHALLIGVIFAILNLIPYVGALVGNVIGVLLTLTSSTEIWPVVTVLLVIAGVQFLDNNILMPRIVGSKVKINAFFAILGVVIGGSIAGVSGMFLSMPIIAVLKVIFDRTDIFKQWGVLLGDERPARSPMSFPVFRKKVPVSTKSGVEHTKEKD
ncbi:AI-2E family transporter [Pedobacter metabolipauper]|uniref:Putative PurR-regulated permease PerM n=1 Tax=Pedobacter metabolipauper TaxID=425513 RepID=A0A4R6SZH0_9SPHI|nr:AI-2E family transporter [Pedobacter metabolipauper]TDQ11477.1 putative PurR-regulated permease PerM [Pedobacter metabolipauper]